MRVTLAAVACVAALVRVDSVSAYAGTDGSRPMAASICLEPSRVVEVVLPGEALRSVDRVERADGVERADRVEPTDRAARAGRAERSDRATRTDLNEAGGTTLWCVSADDPRCSPLETSGHDGMSFGTAKLSYAASDGLEAPNARELAAVSGDTSHRGSARDGFLGRLERPPNRRTA